MESNNAPPDSEDDHDQESSTDSGRIHGGRFENEGDLAAMLIGMSAVFVICQSFKMIPGCT